MAFEPLSVRSREEHFGKKKEECYEALEAGFCVLDDRGGYRLRFQPDKSRRGSVPKGISAKLR